MRGYYGHRPIPIALRATAPKIVVGFTSDEVDRAALDKMFPNWPNLTKRHDAITPSSGGGGDPPAAVPQRRGGGGGGSPGGWLSTGGVVAGGGIVLAIVMALRARKAETRATALFASAKKMLR